MPNVNSVQITSGPNFRGSERALLFPLSIIFSSNSKMDNNLDRYLEVGHVSLLHPEK